MQTQLDELLLRAKDMAAVKGCTTEEIVVSALGMYLAKCSDCGGFIALHDVLCD